MFLRSLTGFRSFFKQTWLPHPKLEGSARDCGESSNTNLRGKSPGVSTGLPTNFHAFSIPFNNLDCPCVNIDDKLEGAMLRGFQLLWDTYFIRRCC
jgi:hypothetical protein